MAEPLPLKPVIVDGSAGAIFLEQKTQGATLSNSRKGGKDPHKANRCIDQEPLKYKIV